MQEVILLYMHAFGTGEARQYMTKAFVAYHLHHLLQIGNAILYVEKEKVVGCIIYHPLLSDKEFPVKEFNDSFIKNSMYVAELMVHSSSRGKGIASLMLDMVADLAIRQYYKHLVLRAWDQNKSAFALYIKCGFKKIAIICQEKKDFTGHIFIMNKLYMSKQL